MILVLTKRPTPYWLDTVHKVNALGKKCLLVTDKVYEETKHVLYLDNKEIGDAGFNSSGFNDPQNHGRVMAWDKALYHACTQDLEYVWMIEDDVYFKDAQAIIDLVDKYKDTPTDLIYNKWITSAPSMNEMPYEQHHHWTISRQFFGGDSFFRSFVPLCRISKKILTHVKSLADTHKTLPYIEAMFPTLCMRHNLSSEILDPHVYEINFNIKPQRSADAEFKYKPRVQAFHRVKDIAATVYPAYPSSPLEEKDKVYGKKTEVVITTKNPPDYWLFTARDINYHLPAHVVRDDKYLQWLSAKDLDYVWLIKDDVYFRNAQAVISMVKEYENDPADLIASSCFERPPYSEWEEKPFQEQTFYESPISICRVSKRLIKEASSHKEPLDVVLPTLCIKNQWIYRNLAGAVSPYTPEGRKIPGTPRFSKDTKYVTSLVEETQKGVDRYFFDNRNLQAFQMVKDLKYKRRRALSRSPLVEN